MLLKVATLIILCYLSVEDFRKRIVPAWTIILLFSAGLFFRFQGEDAGISLRETLLNIGFVFAQFSLLYIYYRFLSAYRTSPFNKMMGMGDVLLVLALTPFLSPVNFIVFYLCSLIIVLMVWGIYIWCVRKKDFRIPLAGALGIFFTFILLVAWITGKDLYSDYWLHNTMYGING